MPRHIIHVDMDAFFASVEQRDHPELAGKPVVVGGRPETRGVVAAASYEARKFGVRSAMAMALAVKKCPNLIIVSPRHQEYEKISRSIMSIFYQFSPLVEQISVDEAFLDVTGSLGLFKTAENIGHEIQQMVWDVHHLTASVGIGPNKFIAKLASGFQKPRGFTVIEPQDVVGFLEPMEISSIWGIGEKTALVLRKLGVKTIKDVKALSLSHLETLFGKQGKQIYYLCRGVDDRPVIPEHEAKSIGKEITFSQDISDLTYLDSVACRLADQVGLRLRRAEKQCRTVTLKIRFCDWETINRSQTLTDPTNLTGTIYHTITSLIKKELPLKKPVRLLGVSVSNFQTGNIMQQSIFQGKDVREWELTRVTDSLKEKYGETMVCPGKVLFYKKNRIK